MAFNTRSPTIKRILKEAQELSTFPSPDYHAAPLEDNLYEWHFTLRGPPAPSPFEGGIYHGRINLPLTYPLRPPSFRFLTPSGRFEVNREICLSISEHHPESWQPAWGLRTALVALRSFMETDAKGQLGGIESTKEVRMRLAKESVAWKCSGCGARCNADVIRAQEEAVVEAEKEGKTTREDVAVPEELKLGYRDEMGKDKNAEQGSSEQQEETGSAHNSGSTAPVSPASKIETTPLPQSLVGGSSLAESPRAGTSTASSALTAVSSMAQQAQTQPRLSTALHQVEQSPLPPWLDKAIIGIAIGLAVMLLRKFLALT